MKITELMACEIYLFSVQVLGPRGYSQRSNTEQVSTSYHVKAPPVNLNLKRPLLLGAENELNLTWTAPCDIKIDPIGYIIEVTVCIFYFS